MSQKVPVSAKWKHRNFSAIFGIMVGVITPFLIASPGLQMHAVQYFRGTGPQPGC